MKTRTNQIRKCRLLGVGWIAALAVGLGFGARPVAATVLVADDFNRTLLGASWSEWTYAPGSAPAQPWFDLVGNRLALTNGATYASNTGYTAYNTDYVLFSSSHPESPYEVVQVNARDDTGGRWTGLSLHMNSLDLGSQYVLRYVHNTDAMQIFKLVSGILQYNVASKTAAVDLQSGTEYTLRGFSDNAGHLRFDILTTGGTLLDSLSATDTQPYGVLSGGYAGVYSHFWYPPTLVTWDNFQVTTWVPEPSVATLLLLGLGLVRRRVIRRSS